MDVAVLRQMAQCIEADRRFYHRSILPQIQNLLAIARHLDDGVVHNAFYDWKKHLGRSSRDAAEPQQSGESLLPLLAHLLYLRLWRAIYAKW